MFVYNGLTYLYKISMQEYNTAFYSNSIDRVQEIYDRWTNGFMHETILMEMHDNTMDFPKILRKRL